MRLTSDASVEFRLERIVKLHGHGRSQTEIASLLDCSQAWVSKVLKRHREQGDAALRVRKGTRGKTALLSPEQLESLKALLLKGALHCNFPTDNWTRERIASLIEQQFSVHYHPAHISRLMRRLGFTLQKPKRRSFKKDEKAVEKWRDETLPALKKKGARGGLSARVLR
jgi:transposase